MQQNRQGFLQQFCEWTDTDIDAYAEQTDCQSLAQLLSVLASDIHSKALRLQHHKQAICQVEEEITNAHTNLLKLQQIQEKHSQKRQQYMEQNKKLDKRLKDCKQQWKRLELQHP